MGRVVNFVQDISVNGLRVQRQRCLHLESRAQMKHSVHGFGKRTTSKQFKLVEMHENVRAMRRPAAQRPASGQGV